jgi:hypothetical protein
MSSNNIDKDIIPPLSLDYDCCAPEGFKSKLNAIHLDLPLKNILNHLDDLRLASHKVEDVDRPIAEQEWKMKRSNMMINYLSYRMWVWSPRVLSWLCCVTVVGVNAVKESFQIFPNDGKTTTFARQ